MVAKGEDFQKLYDAIPKKDLPERLGGFMKYPDQSIWQKDLAKKAKQVTFEKSNIKLYLNNY